MESRITTADRIVAAAELRMRAGGIHGFSFREIAGDVGIKSASVHHHFPTKDDLAAEVVRAYTERHMAALGDPADADRSPGALIDQYIDRFRDDIVKDRLMCLCGVMAAETSSLDDAVKHEVGTFFERNRVWLETVLGRAEPEADPQTLRDKALMVTATLEGALLTAHCLGRQDVFEGVARQLAAGLVD